MRFFTKPDILMNKTLRKKLTEKYHNASQPVLLSYPGGDVQADAVAWPGVGLAHEMHMLHEAAKDLLQPRPEAIAMLLKMAKEI